MPDRRLGPWLSMVGGGTWTAHAIVLGGRPPGCVSEDCWAGATHRPSEHLAWLLLLAVVALALAVGRLAGEWC